MRPDLARRLFLLCESLAPHKSETRIPLWNELSHHDQLVATRAMEVVLSDLARGPAPQDVDFDRNRWQRMVGVLVTLVENHPGLPDGLLTAIYRTVNTNVYTGSTESESYLDIAKLTVEQTLHAAIAAGIVIPGPNAPASLGIPVRQGSPPTIGESQAADEDWTASNGNSNSSPLFQSLVTAVRDHILNGAFDIVNGRAETVANVIVAHLAHKYGLRPSRP